MGLIYGVFTLNYVLYNNEGNDEYDTFLMKMKPYNHDDDDDEHDDDNNNPIIIKEY